jgi:UDP-N-acetylmuramate dehydrogenase
MNNGTPLADNIRGFLTAICGASIYSKVKENAHIARHTTMKTGGKADLYISVSSKEELEFVVKASRANELPYIIIGGGSNILVSDEGVRGLVIGNKSIRTQTSLIDAHNSLQITAESGASLVGIARRSIQLGLAGLEWATTVPGTVGGAVVGNAGAFGGDMSKNLVSTEVLFENGSVEIWEQNDLNYSYRRSALKERVYGTTKPPVVLSATFILQKGDPEVSARLAASNQEYRRKTQPQVSSVGSVFANPPGYVAGKLVELVGLKGYSRGGAQFSTLTGNWIINPDNRANSEEVIFLINLARRRVFEQFGVTLTPEILFLGDWPQFPPYDPL